METDSIKREIIENSSIYAVVQVAKAKSSCRKAWWILVLIIGLLGSGWQITSFVSTFLQYPVAVDVKMSSSSDFPAVTICNLNRMNVLYIPCMKKKESFYACKSYGRPGESGMGPLIISEGRSMSSCSSHLSGIQDKNRQALNSFLGNYRALNSTDREIGGHKMEKFITDCTFGVKSCKRDFTYFQNLRYGNCFTFNKNKGYSNTLNPWIPNHMKGLRVTLDIDEDDYLPITSNAGVRVIIHDSVEDPAPEEKGINISPGFETSISITPMGIKRLQAPYRDRCIDYEQDEIAQGKSRNDCVRICIQQQNFANCSCIDPTLSSSSNQKSCNMTNSTEACCLDKVLESMSIHGLPCNCPLPCFTLEYRLQISTAVLVGSSDDRINVARLNIHYSNFQRTTFVQKPLYENSELVGNLGGHLSLWSGLTLFALFELFEYLIYFCFRLFKEDIYDNKCKFDE